MDLGQATEMRPLVLIVTFFASVTHSTFDRKTNPLIPQSHTWRCVKDGRCLRDDIEGGNDIFEPNSYSYLEGCKSVCGHYGALWPKPTGGVDLGPVLAPFSFDDLSFKFDSSKIGSGEAANVLEDTLTQSWAIFTKNIQSLHPADSDSSPKFMLSKSQSNLPKKLEKRSQVLVSVTVTSSSLDLSLKTAEGYTLSIHSKDSEKVRNEIEVKIHGETFYGVRHAFETLSQLITYDPIESCLRIPKKAEITDGPIFSYRGLLIDTGRNYFSISSLKRIIDGMSYNKLNVLHWHMNEQQAFPFVSQRVPELTSHGAYSEGSVYYMDEVKSLSSYARLRGVLLLPEFDGPSHAAYGWQKWPQEKGLGNFTTCMTNIWRDDQGTLGPEPPAGQLNPVNENLYDVLGDLYTDMIESFSGETSQNQKDSSLNMFHMGGDEVNFHCWYQEKSVRDWMISNHYEVNPAVSPEGYLKLWATFQERALEKLVKANNGKKFSDGVVLWTSELTRPDRIYRYVDKDTYVIQVWTTGYDVWISDLLRMKYKIILSNYDAWYLDCGYGAWLYSGSGARNNWCSPFKDWKVMYENSPREMLKMFALDWSIYGEQILGGEAAMWSEQVDEYSAEAKIWPRSCAVAERLWSDPLIQQGTLDPNLKPDEASYKANWWSEPERRILEQRRRMTSVRGIRSDALQPEFCRQHDGICYNLPKPAPSFGGVEGTGGVSIEEARRMAEIMYRKSLHRRQSPYIIYIEYGIAVGLVVLIIIRRRFFLAVLLRSFEVTKIVAQKMCEVLRNR